MLEYNKEKAAALLKEGHEITRYLKVEVDALTRQIARVLDGGEDEAAEALGRQEIGRVAGAANGEGAKPKSGWFFWR